HDHGDAQAALRQGRLDLETAHAGHVQVQDDAVRLPAREVLEHRPAGRERLGLDPRGSEEPLERAADGLFVIDDGDEQFHWGHGSLSVAGLWPREEWDLGPRSLYARRRPARSAMRTSSATERASIFSITRPRCTLTVFSAMP